MNTNLGLGWDAVKDVVAGTAFYARKHPGVTFARVAATNHWFNQTATDLAEINDVSLWDRKSLKGWLSSHAIARIEMESLLAASLSE